MAFCTTLFFSLPLNFFVKVLHAEDSRRIAETHFDLGVALGHFNKFDEAIKSLESSIAVLKKRIANLKEKTESKDESKASDAFYTREAEITEIESLIPEIEEKIQDTKDMKDQDKEKTQESGFSGTFSQFFLFRGVSIPPGGGVVMNSLSDLFHFNMDSDPLIGFVK